MAAPVSYNADMNARSYTRATALPQILTQRIAILDGAMGTMIQRYKLTEADYRGAPGAPSVRQVQHAGQAALRRRRARPHAPHGEHQPGRE